MVFPPVCQLQANVQGSVSHHRGSTQVISTHQHRVPLELRLKLAPETEWCLILVDPILTSQLSK